MRDLLLRHRLWVAPLVGGLLIGSWFLISGGGRTYTLYFTEATGLHPGDSVNVLDVPVGHVDSIQVERSRVRVVINVDDSVPVPAAARAAILSPSLVSVRHVELTPAYAGGPRLASGAVIGLDRTATPVEWDQVKQQLHELTSSLGPDNPQGSAAMARLLRVGAANLRGNGLAFGTTLSSLTQVLDNVNAHQGDLFATVRNLAAFSAALKSSDTTVHQFVTDLDLATGGLARDRGRLVSALRSLSGAVQDVDGFLRRHHGQVTYEVGRLSKVARLLQRHRRDLADILQSAPTALSNYYNIYDSQVPAMTGTFVGQQFDSPATFVCSALYNFGGTPAQCAMMLAPIAQYIRTHGAGAPVGVNPVQQNPPQQGGPR